VSAKAKTGIALLAGLTVLSSAAHAFDVLRAEQNISATAAGAMDPACAFDNAPGHPLRLAEAV
jgi:outer membrane protein